MFADSNNNNKVNIAFFSLCWQNLLGNPIPSGFLALCTLIDQLNTTVNAEILKEEEKQILPFK